MVTPFQKITLISSILIASAISMPSFAKTEKQCGNGELLVSKKIVGTATYAAENCNKPWLGQNIQMEFKVPFSNLFELAELQNYTIGDLACIPRELPKE